MLTKIKERLGLWHLCLSGKVFGNFIAKTGFKHLNGKCYAIVKRGSCANTMANDNRHRNAKYRKATVVFEMKAFKIRVFAMATLCGNGM